MALSEKAILANRYRIEKLLSQGGMGAVYRAFDTNLEIYVAIKENFYATQEAVVQFKHEALILAKLRHPALPRVIHHFEDGGKQYLVMDFIDGIDLSEMIKGLNQPLNERLAVNYIVQVCDILTYLHNQSPPIIHRDIKPQNIKITPDNRAVLVDFGVAKQAYSSQLTMAGARAVTSGFSPPEQYVSAGTSSASDIYALGATLYTLLTSQMPPDSISMLTGQEKFVPIDRLNSLVTPQLSQAINWAMALEPNVRPQSAKVWKDKLLSIYRKKPTPQPARDLNPPLPAPQTKVMGVSLVKGGNVSLAPNLKQVLVGLGWEAPKSTGSQFDLDGSVFLLKADGKVRYESDFIYYNNLKSHDGAVVHHGSQQATKSDKETIFVNLAGLSADVTKLVFAVSIHKAETRGQNFGMINSAFIRLLNKESKQELVRYDLSKDGNVKTAMIFGQLYRYRGQWKFRAVGQGFKGGLAPLVQHFGIDVS